MNLVYVELLFLQTYPSKCRRFVDRGAFEAWAVQLQDVLNSSKHAFPFDVLKRFHGSYICPIIVSIWGRIHVGEVVGVC